MNFRQRSARDEPEINFIPLIDVLLVILIFLMVTTTYSRYAELHINLPTADAAKAPEHPQQVEVTVDATGGYIVNNTRVANKSREALSEELRRAAGSMKDPVIVITADAQATHQSVIRVMEAAQINGYGKITFTTQAEKK